MFSPGFYRKSLNVTLRVRTEIRDEVGQKPLREKNLNHSNIGQSIFFQSLLALLMLSLLSSSWEFKKLRTTAAPTKENVTSK